VDRWSTAIQAAANKYGVPANLIKAVMKLESNGDPNSTGAPGVWGPMQVNSSAWGYGPWSTDPLANIDKGVAILKDGYNGNWDDALIAYRGGWGSDGYTTGQTYLDAVHANLAQLDAMPMSPVGFDPTGGTESHGSTTAGLSSMFDSQNISYEFGVNSDLGYYDYGTSYGLNGVQHTGIDVSMPYGTAYRAPMGGTVTCSGTGTGQGGTGDGCGAFNSYDDSGNINGAGRVEITLDNGVVLIYGHSSRAAVQIGQRVNAGDIVGYSGSMNGPHVHLEARIRDASMPSGWRIVDPRTVLGGASFGGAAPNGFSQVTTPAQTTGTDWGSMMMNFLLQPGFHW
jgi:murein DD-endopeptidase MepM/ murein hydrolase activator NlpD